MDVQPTAGDLVLRNFVVTTNAARVEREGCGACPSSCGFSQSLTDTHANFCRMGVPQGESGDLAVSAILADGGAVWCGADCV